MRLGPFWTDAKNQGTGWKPSATNFARNNAKYNKKKYDFSAGHGRGEANIRPNLLRHPHFEAGE